MKEIQHCLDPQSFPLEDIVLESSQSTIRQLAKKGTATLNMMKGKSPSLQLSFDSRHHFLPASFNRFLFKRWVVIVAILADVLRNALWFAFGDSDLALMFYIYTIVFRVLLFGPLMFLWCLSFNADVFKMIARTFE